MRGKKNCPIPGNGSNFEKYRDVDFWSYPPALFWVGPDVWELWCFRKIERYVSNETFCVHVPPPAFQNGLCCSEVKRLWSAAVIWAWCSCSKGVGKPEESCLLPMEFTSLLHCLLDLSEVALAGRSWAVSCKGSFWGGGGGAVVHHGCVVRVSVEEGCWSRTDWCCCCVCSGWQDWLWVAFMRIHGTGGSDSGLLDPCWVDLLMYQAWIWHQNYF